jgi:hypothetical protein
MGTTVMKSTRCSACATSGSAGPSVMSTCARCTPRRDYWSPRSPRKEDTYVTPKSTTSPHRDRRGATTKEDMVGAHASLLATCSTEEVTVSVVADTQHHHIMDGEHEAKATIRPKPWEVSRGVTRIFRGPENQEITTFTVRRSILVGHGAQY